MTSTASSEGGPAGRSAAREELDGPYCIEPRHRAVVVVDRAPTRPIPPRPSRSSVPWRPSCCRATATTRTRGTPQEPWRSSLASSRRRVRARVRCLPAAGRCRRRRRPPTRPSGRPSARGTPRHGSERRPGGRDAHAPVDAEMQLDCDDAVRVRDLDAVVARPRSLDEPRNAVDLERGISRIARQDVRAR